MTKLYTPLRYPGGKLKIYKRVLRLIELNGLTGHTYVEPFAGGFGVGIRLLIDDEVPSVILNDSDPHIFCFWNSVLNQSEELCALISNRPITIEERTRQKEIYRDRTATPLAHGFALLFLNRVNYSGIIKGGPLGGNDQAGDYRIDCRFPKERIIAAIRAIATKRDHVQLFNMDASDFMRQAVLAGNGMKFLNIDPPYFGKGAALYRNYYRKDDHKEFADLMRNEVRNQFPWIMTYDDAQEIKDLYAGLNMRTYNLCHSAQGAHIGKEIVIFANVEHFEWEGADVPEAVVE